MNLTCNSAVASLMLSRNFQLFRTCQSDFIEIVHELYGQPSYIYVWKLNQTMLELDFRAVKFLFFPRQDLNSHHSLSLMSSALDHSTTSTAYIYIFMYIHSFLNNPAYLRGQLHGLPCNPAVNFFLHMKQCWSFLFLFLMQKKLRSQKKILFICLILNPTLEIFKNQYNNCCKHHYDM